MNIPTIILTPLFIAGMLFQSPVNAQSRPPTPNSNEQNQRPTPDRNPQNQNNAQPPENRLRPRELPDNIDSAAMQDLGRMMFFDGNLSNPVGQSCASCHLPEAGFTDPNDSLPTSEGAVAGRFGKRNAPTVSYSQFIPPFQNNTTRQRRGSRGGLFLDGRANTLEDQAKSPFLNSLEMNNTNADSVIAKISTASYAEQFKAIFGENALLDSETAFNQVTQAVAAFERSQQLALFNSRFDEIIQGNTTASAAELRGVQLFTGRADCVRCHLSDNLQGQLFTDFSYANIGVPANPDNPFYGMDPSINPQGANFIDLGLGGITGIPRQNGQFRVPTLRNVSLTAPYMHNGVFQTLEEVVEFYNTRDLNPEQFPAEVSANISQRGRIGNLNLSVNEVQDLVAFLKTLSDRSNLE